MSESLVKKLKIGSAIEKEGESSRNLIPPEVDWAQIVDNSIQIEKWIRAQLRGGFQPAGQETTIVRKVHGTRPVPVWGITERIIYRALTEYVVGRDFKVDRSAEAYLNFIRAPVVYSQSLRQQSDDKERIFSFFESEVKYIVKSDITAFYQYVDHAVLGRELQVLGGDFDAISHLLDLLREIQGRSYGLPQLLDSSDVLSEVYIDRVERDLLRHGFPTWRFNDDFRIACKSYHETLDAIERLDASARDVGLVISESKTLTFRTVNYILKSLSLKTEENAENVLVDDVEALVGDYTDSYSKDTKAAISYIRSAKIEDPTSGEIDLTAVTMEQVRVLRRAFSSITRAKKPDVLDQVFSYFVYIPALTPTLFRYISSVYDSSPADVEELIDKLTRNASLNEWQRQWIIYTIHDLSLLHDKGNSEAKNRIDWIKSVRVDSPSKITSAYATLALAAARELRFSDIVQGLDLAPMALQPWYLSAMHEYYSFDKEKGLEKQKSATASMSPLHRALVNYDPTGKN